MHYYRAALNAHNRNIHNLLHLLDNKANLPPVVEAQVGMVMICSLSLALSLLLSRSRSLALFLALALSLSVCVRVCVRGCMCAWLHVRLRLRLTMTMHLFGGICGTVGIIVDGADDHGECD